MSDRLSDQRGPLVRALTLIAVFVVAGAVAGVLWERLWDAPAGVAYQGEWFLEPAGPDVSFEGTALFVLIAFPLGVVLAVLAGIRRGHEVGTVATVLVAASLSGIVMYAVGSSLGPSDPQALAAGAADFTALDSQLGLTAPDNDRDPYLSTALVALPTGAMTGLVAMYLFGSSRVRRSSARVV